MLSGGSRALQHLSDYHHHHTSIGLGFCGAKIVQLSSFFLRPSQAKASGNCSYKLRHRMVSSSGFHYRTSGETPIIHSCFRLLTYCILLDLKLRCYVGLLLRILKSKVCILTT